MTSTVFFHRERRRARFVQDPKLLGHQLHFAGRQIRIHRVRRALRHGAFHRDHVFRAEHLRLLVDRRVGVGMKHDLRDAIAVAQVNKDDTAQVATPVDPAHQQGPLARVGGAQLTAGVRAAKVA